MKNLFFKKIYSTRNLKYLFLLLLIGAVSCTHRQSASKSGSNDSISQDTVSRYSKVPKWLVGTWKAKFTEAQYGMNIQFIIVIKPDGSITQTSIVPDEENEVLSGKCISVDDNTLTVGFENQDDYTLYYLDKKSNKLGISGSNWLTKK
jgi:hypothetical protein